MSTTFVLHGGVTSRVTAENDSFFRTFTSAVDKEKVKIVLCYWAKMKERWDELSKRDQAKVQQQTTKQVEFSVAHDVDDLYKKLQDADVLYVSGGKATLIEPYVPKLSALREKLKGKVYIGSSMGAFICSKQYVLSFASQDSDTVHNGLGLLPINTLCHWDIEDKKKRKLDLLAYATPKLPTVVLDECQCVTIVDR